jgi:hypothetical protein
MRRRGGFRPIVGVRAAEITSLAAGSSRVDPDGLLQLAFDAGVDDVRACVHCFDWLHERLTFAAGS